MSSGNPPAPPQNLEGERWENEEKAPLTGCGHSSCKRGKQTGVSNNNYQNYYVSRLLYNKHFSCIFISAVIFLALSLSFSRDHPCEMVTNSWLPRTVDGDPMGKKLQLLTCNHAIIVLIWCNLRDCVCLLKFLYKGSLPVYYWQQRPQLSNIPVTTFSAGIATPSKDSCWVYNCQMVFFYYLCTYSSYAIMHYAGFSLVNNHLVIYMDVIQFYMYLIIPWKWSVLSCQKGAQCL